MFSSRFKQGEELVGCALRTVGDNLSRCIGARGAPYVGLQQFFRACSKIIWLMWSLIFFALCFTQAAHADWQKIQESGSLKVAVYTEFAPYSDQGTGIDIDLAQALAKQLGLKLSLLPFPAGEEVGDDLRNMVWKGHYLGYGPADVMLHVPVDKQLMAAHEQVEIFAPYHVETVRLVRNAKTVPNFEGLDSLEDKKIGVEKISISAMLMLGEANGKFRDNVKIFPTAIDALQALKAEQLDAVLATRSEIDSVLKSDAEFPLHEVFFQRLPRAGWILGMAVKKDNLELAKRLQAAMNVLNENGELKGIFAKYGVRLVQP